MVTFSLSSLAKNKTKKTFVVQKYSRIMCNQKNIPLKIEQSLNAHLLTVNFFSEKAIEAFTIDSVRGLDGVNIEKFHELINQKLDIGESVETNVELGDFSGMVYIVFDITIKVNGVITKHSIPVAVGTLSQEQIILRSKNIKEVKTRLQEKDGTNAISVPVKKLHVMQMD
jgi:hypothetical protein